MIEEQRRYVKVSDVKLWAEVFGVKWISASYHLTRCDIKAQMGDPKSKKKWAQFQNAKALKRLTS